tara:strand:+ start:88 stop:597 length:510 start_codon:yes stop_codon:yes gene_type:complete
MFKYESLLKRSAAKSVSSLFTTKDSISIVDLTLSKLGTVETVDEVELVPPVIVSDATKVPTGMVITNVLAKKSEEAAGKDVIVAVAPLVAPVTVSPTVKPEEEAAIKVKVPAGYSVTPEAAVIDVCWTVHWFSPRLAHSANIKFKERLAVFKSFPVLTSKPHLSKASSM